MTQTGNTSTVEAVEDLKAALLAQCVSLEACRALLEQILEETRKKGKPL